MKKTKRILALFLSVVMLFCMGIVPVTADSDTIHYSDLFFGYNTNYLRTGSALQAYANDTSEVLHNIQNDFYDSPQSTLMEWKTALNAATSDLLGYARLLSDAYGDGNYNAESALDKANEYFMKEMLKDNYFTVGNSVFGNSKKIANKIKDVLNIGKEFIDAYDVYELTDEQIVIEYINYLSENFSFECLSYTQIRIFEQVDFSQFSDFFSLLGDGITALEIAEGLSLGFAIEDLRLAIIDDIISYATEGTFLYDGMLRLRTQLENGWIEYFVQNYFKQQMLSYICKQIVKNTAGALFTDWGIITAIMKVASWIVFDAILNVPSMNDVLAQHTLMQYKSSMYLVLSSKLLDIHTADDVYEYEDLFSAYVAVTNAALNATDGLTSDSNRAQLTAVKNQYADFNYSTFIESVVSDISAIKKEDRQLRSMNWYVTLPVTVKNASDEIEPGCIYLFDGAIQGNVSASGEGGFNFEDRTTVITGNLYAENLIFSERNNLTVNGDMSVDRIEFSNSIVRVNGNCNIFHSIHMNHPGDYLLVNGDFTGDWTRWENEQHSTWGGDYYYHDSSLTAGEVEVKGDFTIRKFSYPEEGSHYTVFSGTKKQTVRWLEEYNGQFNNCMRLTNPDIDFATYIPSLYLDRDYTLKYTKDLSVGTLDLNGHTLSNLHDLNAETVIADGADITAGGDVSITALRSPGGYCRDITAGGNAGIYNADCNVGDISVNGNLSTNALSLGANLTVGGDVNVSGSDWTAYDEWGFNNTHAEIGGDFILTGDYDITLSMTHPDDYLLVNGDFTVTGDSIRTELTNGTIELKGDFTDSSTENSEFYDRENHIFVFSGGTKQTISWANYHPNHSFNENLQLINPDIEFATPIWCLGLDRDFTLRYNSDLSVSELFLHGHTLSNLHNLTADYVSSDGADLTVSGNADVGQWYKCGDTTVSGNMSLGELSFVQGKNLTVGGNLTFPRYNALLVFNQNRLTVGGDFVFGNGDNMNGVMEMTHPEDYLLVNGDFVVQGVSSDYYEYATGVYYGTELSDGTIELKGDFTENCGDQYCFYNYGKHRFVFSGTGTQVIRWKNYDNGNCYFSNLALRNTDIDFATPIYKLILNQDFTVTDAMVLNVDGELNLNGYKLYELGDLSYGYLNTNGGMLIPDCYYHLTEIPGTAPTCTSNGTITYYRCEDCGLLYKDLFCQQEIGTGEMVVTSGGHTWGAWRKLNGTQHMRTCANNADHTETENHVWNEGSVTKPASCTTEGRRTFVCTVCHASKKEPISATGHFFGDWEWLDDTLHQRTCSNDNRHTITEPHDWDAGEITEQPTCVETGSIVYTCETCGATLTENLPATISHTWDRGEVTSPATCAKTGTIIYTCVTCGATLTETLPQTSSHTWDEGMVTTLPTCAKTGVITYTCTSCGTTITGTLSKGVAHTWNEGTVTTSATCAKTGIKTFTCTICSVTMTENLPKSTFHSWNKGEITAAATCVQTGIITYTCNICGNSTTETLPKSTSHTWNEGVTTTPATITETGNKTYTCVFCGTTKTEVIPKITPTALIASSVTRTPITFYANGKQQQPAVTVTNEAGEVLTEGVDYRVVYPESTEPGSYMVRVDGINGYKGTVRKTYTIKEREALDAANVIRTPIKFNYTGKQQQPTVTVKNAAGKTLTENVDYKVIYPTSIEPGDYMVRVDGINGYKGTVRKKYTILTTEALDASRVFRTPSVLYYDGKQQQPTVTVKNVAGETLTEGVDYKVTYPESIKPGSYMVRVDGINGYTGTIRKVYTIKEKEALAAANVTRTPITFTANGTQQQPTVIVTNAAGKTLTEGVDYTVTYPTSIEPGSYMVRVDGINGYKGTIRKTYTIR